MKKTNEKNTVVHDKMKPIITIMVSYLIRVYSFDPKRLSLTADLLDNK